MRDRTSNASLLGGLLGAGMIACAVSPPSDGPNHPAPVLPAKEQPRFAALVFTRTAGFRHESIPAGIEAVAALAGEHGFTAVFTEDAAEFTDASLAQFGVIAFLNTSGDVLNDAQQSAMERFVRQGGGFVGIHSATDTEHDWEWYGRLVGARFGGHPEIQDGVIDVVNRDHPSTRFLPRHWPRRDEWYNFQRAPAEAVTVLARLDESSYSGGTMGDQHPIAWCHEFDGGRAWYTGGGHTIESFSEPLFRQHLLAGIEWAAGVPGNPSPR
jgi:type 1 glutamine amidotransferase